MILTAENRLLLSMLYIRPEDSVNHKIIDLVAEVRNWDRFIYSAVKNGLAPITYKKFLSAGLLNSIPEKVSMELKKVYFRTLGNNVVIFDHFKLIVGLFSKENIDVIPLKGIFLAEKVYEDIGIRQLSDIDLLVQEKDAETCRNILLQNGYSDNNPFPSKLIKRQEKHLAPLIKAGVSVEIHTRIHRLNSSYNVDVGDFFLRSVHEKLLGIDVQILIPNDLLLHLCIHLNNHLEVKKLQLKQIGDLVNVLKFYKKEIDWDAFNKNCLAYNCLDLVVRNLMLVHKFCGMDIPEFVINSDKDVDYEMRDVILKTLQFDLNEIEYEQKKAHYIRNIQNAKAVKGIGGKLSHLIGDVFPSRSFMIQNYKIKNKGLVYFYYPYRFLIGIKKLVKYTCGKAFSGKIKQPR